VKYGQTPLSVLAVKRWAFLSPESGESCRKKFQTSEPCHNYANSRGCDFKAAQWKLPQPGL